MLDILIDAIIDSFKLIPFLFVTYLIMEYLEHKTSDKHKEHIKKSGKLGPIIGSFLGAFPQCGFSVSATNLYVGRVISLGTLIAVYLSTSDEMIPIFFAENVRCNCYFKSISDQSGNWNDGGNWFGFNSSKQETRTRNFTYVPA